MARKKMPDEERYQIILAAVSDGDTVYYAAKKADRSDEWFRLRRKDDPALEERFQDAQVACDRSRVAKAWKTVISALEAIDERGHTSSVALKAAAMILYSNGQLTDTRRMSIEHSGKVSVLGLAELSQALIDDGPASAKG